MQESAMSKDVLTKNLSGEDQPIIDLDKVTKSL